MRSQGAHTTLPFLLVKILDFNKQVMVLRIKTRAQQIFDYKIAVCAAWRRIAKASFKILQDFNK